jgi:hypothetical protein
MKNFHFYILFLILLINIITKETSNDLLVFKFKTYYPTKIDNNSEYNSGDFVNSFISSKAFLELESGNENEFEKGTNQTLRTFVNDKTNIFVFRDYYRKNNISFCDFNASFSSSYKVKMISDQYCESIQTVCRQGRDAAAEGLSRRQGERCRLPGLRKVHRCPHERHQQNL